MPISAGHDQVCLLGADKLEQVACRRTARPPRRARNRLRAALKAVENVDELTRGLLP